MTTWTRVADEVAVAWTDIWKHGSLLTVAPEAFGTSYLAGDKLLLTANGDGAGKLEVTGVHPGTGEVITVSIEIIGDDYIVDEVCATLTTSISGSGCTIKINSVTNTSSLAPAIAVWNTLKGGVWNLGSLVAWEDLDKHDWEDWN